MFGLEAKYIGAMGLTLNVPFASRSEGFEAVIDNKAYSRYTINNDCHN